jgi:hypothetical protein
MLNKMPNINDMAVLDLTADTSMSAKFSKFHAANPEVWNLFKRFTSEIMDAGNTHYSADAVLHRVRWETALSTGETFKINNNYSAFYARLYHREFPKHAGFFMTRISVADLQLAA